MANDATDTIFPQAICKVCVDGLHPASPRSGREHKAWGVSPRFRKNGIEPAKRAIAVLRDLNPDDSAAARSAGLFNQLLMRSLGLTPQAL